jgi:hypothetical protein
MLKAWWIGIFGGQDKTSGDRVDFSGREFNKARITNIIPRGGMKH